jgi:hypothetical protein
MQKPYFVILNEVKDLELVEKTRFFYNITNNQMRGKIVTHHTHTEHPVRPKRKWWQWVALGLMLLAIGMYVLSLDDSVIPEVKGNAGGPPPAANAGPGQ